MSLLSRLFLLVAVALLPAIAIQAYNEIELRQSRRVEVEQHALNVARLAASEQQQIVQGIRQVLIALSELPAIKANDTEACDAYMSTIKRSYPGFITFIAVDMSGKSFCDTNNNQMRPTVEGRAYFNKALSTGDFSIGEFAVSRSTGSDVLHFAIPFYGDERRMEGVVIAALSLDWLADSIARKGVEPGAALTITDRDGTVLARYPENDRFVGKKQRDNNVVGISGTADTRDIDGVERIVGYSDLPADSGGLHVNFGLDKRLAFAEIQSRTERGVLLIILSTSLVLMLTWLGARQFIHRPLGQLVNAANEWRVGHYARRVNVKKTHSEIFRVADAFNTMADALQQRERELRDAKEKAEEAAARITTVFESTTDSVVIVDRDWRITYLNERAKAYLAEGRDLIGKELWQVISDNCDAASLAPVREAMSEQSPARFDAYCEQRDAWFEVNAFPSSQGLALYFRDVTEHKNALEARRVMAEQLHQSQKMEAVGQLTGGVAHDFNNLLSVILGNLTMLRKQSGDDGRTVRLVDNAIEGAERGAALTQRLLAFARRQELSPRIIDVPKLVGGMGDLIRRTLGPEIQIATEFPPFLPPVNADPNQLELALLNLMVNARDAMPQGGTITISARVETIEEARASELKPGCYVCVTLEDTGVGMDAATLARASEPFFTTKGMGKGTGLGLSMVHGFAAQSGGMLKLSSELDIGTSVEIWLPEGTRAAQDAPVAEPPPRTLDRSCTILVVDDEPLVAAATIMMAEDLGHETLVANSGEGALKILAENCSIDAVISDQSMPGMTGIELAQRIREQWPDMPIVIATGHTDLAENRALGLPTLAKPFREEELSEMLAKIVRQD